MNEEKQKKNLHHWREIFISVEKMHFHRNFVSSYRFYVAKANYYVSAASILFKYWNDGQTNTVKIQSESLIQISLFCFFKETSL